MTNSPDDAARMAAAEHVAKYFPLFGPCLIPRPGVELPSCHEPETLICCGCEIEKVFLAGYAKARLRAEEEMERQELAADSDESVLRAEIARLRAQVEAAHKAEDAKADYAKMLRAVVACLREGLEQFALNHEHAPDLAHTRALGDTYGWCDYCATKVEWGSDPAREALARAKELEGGG